MKKVWITSLEKDQKDVQRLLGTVRQYGLNGDGHFWVDDLEKMAWDGALEPLTAKETALWIIMGGDASWEKPSVRKGLSLLALAVQHRRGYGFPILLLTAAKAMDVNGLPTPFRGAEVLPLSTSAPGPKIVALASRPATAPVPEYRLNLHALHGIGLWFEVGPAKDGFPWEGVMFGVHGADIDAHGVGPADGIPARTVLEYQVKGMKVTLGEEEFTTWAARNRLDASLSYYVRTQGAPDKILFGPYAADDNAEVHVLSLV
ncbi:MAG TPA: hypothetical protein PKV74_00620 [Syntrophales bacterium]|nr:hypothetical protein [Syntrophales bacterium]